MMDTAYNRVIEMGPKGIMLPETIHLTLDATHMRCPLPLLKTKMALKTLAPEDILLVLATDSGAKTDIPRFIAHSQHRLILEAQDGAIFQFYIQVGS